MIHYDPAEHIYTREDGTVLPSVTQILAPLKDFRRIPRDILDRASRFGEAVHEMVRLEIDDRLDESTLDPHLVPLLAQWRACREEQGWLLVDADVTVADLSWGYAGRYDLVCQGKHGLDLIDLKTGRESPADGPQLAAYAQCYSFSGRLINLYIRSDSWTLVDRTATRGHDYDVFLACLTIHRHLHPVE